MPTQRQQISASIQANFPDNTSQFITPARLRTEQGLFENYVVLNEQTASIIAEAVASSSAGTGLVTTASFNAFTASTNTFTQSIQTQVNALEAATGSYITSAQTGSMSVLSASYASSSTSASYAATASFALNSSTTGSFTGSFTGSLLGTASYATTALNASDILIYVKNSSGAQIDKGKVVRIIGAVGDNPLIVTASYENDANSANTLGITNENIANDAFGYVITEGTLIGIDTSAFSAGQLLYLGPTGSITGSAPVAPLHNVRLGEALRIQLNNGSMYVRIDNGYELGELHDVVDTTTTSSYGDLLVKSGSVWTNSFQLTGSYGLTGSLSINGTPVVPVDTSAFATTGSNVFSGSQTFNTASLYLNTSGSNPLFSNFTQSVSGQAAYGNILGFFNTAFSASVIFSGSRNIGFISPINNTLAATTRGGGNYIGNYGILGASYTTASAPAVITNNMMIGSVTNNIPNTSSVTSFGSNFLGGTVTITGSATSNVTINANSVDSITIANNWSGSGANQSIQVTNNIIKSVGGTFASLIDFGGFTTNANARLFNNNLLVGIQHTASLVASASSAVSNLLNTSIIGSNLIVSGTMLNNSTSASMFVGQFNETGSLADPSQIKFAVGAGLSSATRLTPVYVSGSGEVFIKPNTTGFGRSVFSPNSVKIADGVVNGSFSTVAAGNGVFVVNQGNISSGQTNVIIGGEVNAITAARSSAIIAGSYNTLNTNTITDTNNLILGALFSTISGSNSKYTGIFLSSGSAVTQSAFSAIIAGNAGTKLNNTTGSVALGRDTAYTGTANYTLYTQNIDASGSINVSGSLLVNGSPVVAPFPYTGSATISGSLQVNGTVDNTLATTVVGTGSVENRIHTKQAGAIAAGAISSSAFISPEIGLEATSANYKVILERNLTGSIGPSGSYSVTLEYVNHVLVSGGTDSYVGLGKISGYCLPGKGANAPSASIISYINNDSGMIPAISASYNGTLYQIWAKHQGGASSSFAYTGQEFYHSGSTQ